MKSSNRFVVIRFCSLIGGFAGLACVLAPLLIFFDPLGRYGNNIIWLVCAITVFAMYQSLLGAYPANLARKMGPTSAHWELACKQASLVSTFSICNLLAGGVSVMEQFGQAQPDVRILQTMMLVAAIFLGFVIIYLWFIPQLIAKAEKSDE